MAVPVLANAAPDVYMSLLEEQVTNSRRLSELEQDAFGWTHATVGGKMARWWSFPEPLVTMVENHCQSSFGNIQPGDITGDLIVALSGCLPSTADTTWPEVRLMEQAYHAAMGDAALPLPRLLSQIDVEYAELAPLMKLPVSDQSLADFYRQTDEGA
jgi:HD-like signal output (HDOD) protein